MMPDPTPARENLGRLVGTWRGSERMAPSEWAPEGFVADGESVGREALGGFCVVSDYRQSKGGEVTFEGHGVYAWDASTKEVVLQWFDSMGSGREEFRGTWEGDVLTLTSKNAIGYSRLTHDFAAEGRLRSRMEMGPSLDALKTLFEGEYAISGATR